jgi:Zn-dependent protease
MLFIVGPITSFVIAAILGLAWWILTSVAQGTGSSPIIANTNNVTLAIEATLQYCAIINTMLGGFNLVPAFPLDSGRILRCVLLRWKRDYDRSTKIAVRIGTAISYVFMAIGFIIMLSGSFIVQLSSYSNNMIVCINHTIIISNTCDVFIFIFILIGECGDRLPNS